MFDAHIHMVTNDIDKIKSIVTNSKYRDIYLGYSAINYDKLDISEHLKACDGGFVMPYAFKETNIREANVELKKFADKSKLKKYYYVPFIDEELYDEMVFDKTIGLKEHFYIHDSFKFYQRLKAYEYLNDEKKLLIIHCDNSIRINYIKFLHEKFPDMKIQVAHLGVFRNSPVASRLVLDELIDLENVYFDISTIFDHDLIKYAINSNPEKVLFGTDVPYIQDDDYMKKYFDCIDKCDFNFTDRTGLMESNAKRLVDDIL